MKKLIGMLAFRKPSSEYEFLRPFQKNFLRRSIYFHKLYSLVENIPGEFIECGVGMGVGACQWASLLEDDHLSRNLWLFDSFEGFPEFSEKDNKNLEKVYRTSYRRFDIDFIRSALSQFGISDKFVNERIHFVKGLFPSSVARVPKLQAAIVYIDFDIYEPTREAILYFYPLLAKGGVMAFDEYDKEAHLRKWPGARKAVGDALRLVGFNGKMTRDA